MTPHLPLVIALSACLAWTLIFSMSSRPGIRGYRNLGILAAYVCLLVFFFRVEWKSVVTTWAIFGLAGGVTYTFWEIVQRTRTKEEEKPKVGLMHFVPAMAVWPVMIPEAVEYVLAEFGLLKAEEKEPNQTHQHNAGSRPSVDDSPASDTPSSPDPRG